MTPPLITEEGPGLFLSWSFWLGGLLSLAVWTGIWYGVRAFFDYLYTFN